MGARTGQKHRRLYPPRAHGHQAPAMEFTTMSSRVSSISAWASLLFASVKPSIIERRGPAVPVAQRYWGLSEKNIRVGDANNSPNTR